MRAAGRAANRRGYLSSIAQCRAKGQRLRVAVPQGNTPYQCDGSAAGKIAKRERCLVGGGIAGCLDRRKTGGSLSAGAINGQTQVRVDRFGPVFQKRIECGCDVFLRRIAGQGPRLYRGH